MRKRWIFAAIALLVAAYWAWPFVGAVQLARAATGNDPQAVVDRVIFPELRRSLARQVIRAYLHQSGRGEKMGALQRGLAISVGTSVADPYLAQLLSPENLTTLLGSGQIRPLTVDGRTVGFDRHLPELGQMLSAKPWTMLLNSHFEGPASFVFRTADEDDDTGGYGIHLRLNGGTWRLSGIDLPSTLTDRIAAAIVAQEKARTAS